MLKLCKIYAKYVLYYNYTISSQEKYKFLRDFYEFFKKILPLLSKRLPDE